MYWDSYFSVIRAKTFRMRKNFLGSNATLLPRFFCLCIACMKMMKKVILAESPVNIWVVKYGTDDKLNADILMGI